MKERKRKTAAEEEESWPGVLVRPLLPHTVMLVFFGGGAERMNRWNNR